MVESKSKQVKMEFGPLYNYVINTNYRNMAGVVSLGLSVVAAVVLVAKWSELSNGHKFAFATIALLFTVINPLMLAFRTFKQLKLSESYKKPIEYTFGDKGILLKQGDLEQNLPWKYICRILLTNKILAIYTSRVHACVIPLSALGDDKGKILAAVVQFTAEYKPQISRNLKEYQSGKGI